MTKRNHKQPALLGAVFRLPDWTPLFTDAFFRARDCVGSRTIAAHDLYRDLLAGHVPSAIREFDRNEAEIRTGILKPDFWQQFVLEESAWLPTDGKPDPGMRLWLRDADLFPFWSAMFYARRAELDQFYPAPTAKLEQFSAAAGFPRRDTRGGKSDIEWEKVLIDAAVLMARYKYRRLVDLKDAIYELYKEKWTADSVEDSTLTRHLSVLFKRLEAVLDR